MDLVGRDAEMRVLDDALREASAGHGRVVLVAGDPGIGKTALLETFAGRAAADGVTVLWGAGWDGGGAPPYWPWVQVLRAAVRAPGGAVVDRLADQLGPLGPAGPAAVVPDRFLLYDAVAQVLTSVAHHAPALVVLDDVHASGPATSSLLEFVARHARQAPVLLVAAHRPAETAAHPDIAETLGRVTTSAVVVEPRGFGLDEIARLLPENAAADSRLVATVLDRTQGNPLFVRHVAQHLVTGGAPWETGLPLGLRDALRRQAEGVVAGTDWPALLVGAAVLGPDLRLSALAALLGADPAGVLPVLCRAVNVGLLVPDQADPERYHFSHALVREALVEGHPPAERAALHLRAARILTEEGVGPERLAHHYAAAGPAGGSAEAVHYSRLAGDAAASARAYAEAATHYRTALAAGSRSAELTTERRCRLLLALARAEEGAGRVPAARRTAELAAGLAERLGDAALFSQAALLVAEHLEFNATDEAAIDLLRRAEACWDGATTPLRARVLARTASATAHLDREGATAHARLAEAAARDDPGAMAAALSAALYVDWGRHDPRTALARAGEMARWAPDAAAQCEAALWTLGFALELGDTERAEQAVATVETLAERSRLPAMRHLAMSRRATLLILRGALEEGTRLALSARDLAVAAGVPDADAVLWGQLYAVWRLGELPGGALTDLERIVAELTETSPYRYAHEAALVALDAARGDPAAAARLDRLVAIVEGLPRDMVHVWTLALLADDCVRLGRPDAGARVYEALVPFADRFVVAAGGVVCLGSAAHELGRLARLLGRHADARAHLAAAADAHRAAGCDHLTMLSERGLAEVTPHRARVVIDGSVVTVRLAELSATLPRSLGLTYLAALVEHAGTDIAATRLAGLADGVEVVSGGTDEVIDRAALSAYRARLDELDAEIAEARDWHDSGRLDGLERERDALLAEVSRSVGLAGRTRRFGDEAERARVNVTRAIRSAIRKVTEQSPDLGRHLQDSVRTGGLCCYDPPAGAAGPQG